jgi:hypothetical protein
LFPSTVAEAPKARGAGEAGSGSLEELGHAERSSSKPLAALDVHDAVVGLIEPAEMNGPEEDGPDAVSDLLETDGLAPEQMRDEDLLVSPAQGGVVGDLADLEMRWVGDGSWVAGEGPEGRDVEGGRPLLLESLVRALEVEGLPKGIERPLLGAKSRPGRESGVFLQGAVHALVPAILLRFAGLGELGGNAERDPPDGQTGETTQSIGGKGSSVVGADPVREAVFAEEMLEAAACELRIDALEAAALEEKSGVGILDGEGIAEGPIAGPELAFEVGGPGGIGRIHGIGRRPGMGATPTRLAGGDEVVLNQDAMDGIDGGCDFELILQDAPDLRRSPAVAAANLKDALDYGLGGQVRAGVRPVGAILEPGEALLLIALDPFVTRGARDAIAAAELGEGKEGAFGFQHETGAFSGHCSSLPRHGQLLSQRKPPV